MRRLLALAALVLAAVVHAPAEAAPAVQRVGLRLSFDGTGNGSYVISGAIQTDATHPAVLALVSTFGKDTFAPEVVELGADGPSSTYGAAGNHSLCPPPLTCTVSPDGGTLGFSSSYSIQGDGKHAFHTRDYLVLQGAKVTFDHAGVGNWSLHRFSSWTRVVDTQAGYVGARSGGEDLEVDRSVRAAGGPGGSIAIAVPPCDVGGGVATLSGGDRGAQPVVCPSSAVSGLATKRTTWSLDGALAGTTNVTTRLLVLPR